ncbi:MAG TPA: RNA 3'-terminal phosphate cyclase [Spirochaetota bacterium]|mgnify:CR=1 FL=1|nr:RNA 3'-terminal phosphate cyclase [Spirochaetota bacterium]HPC42552.1 RNA 3'-terminal phosphate cyclase [Spirochaetota bacterium]HPL15506.1 RNA 3'-terminal phosphate cyclase [Spirochaetota bacterium]HQF10160.1 RNA 3'-terminal phosphate cyclase [Spirochaetota bacterium]HQH98944.1 RNA 3'-terminal phosphate cyclase [Spirochaetota bacterium]
METIDIPNPDWTIIRQALSLALMKTTPITIGRGAAFIAEHPEYRPIFDDIARMAGESGAGRLIADAGSIIFEPHPLAPGKFRYETGHVSSAVEILLFLMPALYHYDFRSVLDLGGVTHSPLSVPTAFVKESLLAALERRGLYGSLTLRRFGFHGSGGGNMESRIYPREARNVRLFTVGGPPEITGARIFISRLDTGLAELEKGMIVEKTGMDAKSIAIIEIMESDGPGNGIQVFASLHGMPVVLFREMMLYDSRGELAFSEEALHDGIDGLAGETRRLLEGSLPELLVRELIPYCALTGSETPPAGASAGISMTRELCETML